MARKKYKQLYTYECSITEEKYTLTRKAPNPDELISVKAYYELNPEQDDRTEAIKKKLEE